MITHANYRSTAASLLPKQRIVQANLHKCSANTTSFFRHTTGCGADVLLLEEPYIFQQPGNPAWLTSSLTDFTPIHQDCASPPRTLTLVSQRVVKAFQVLHRPELAPAGSGDMLTIKLTARGARSPTLRIVNRCNPLASDANRDARLIPFPTNHDWGAVPTLLAGDLNLRHPVWAAEGERTPPRFEAHTLSQCLAEGQWALGLTVGTVTHPASAPRNAIDLTLFNPALQALPHAASFIEDDLLSTSHHLRS